MITLIKKIKVYQPELAGVKDVLIVGGKIAAVRDEIDVDLSAVSEVFTEISGEGKVLTAGFIDSHAHIMGGGGEGGYSSRTPESVLTDFTRSGITTVVGTLGTDGVTRNMVSLLAKAKGLSEEGLNTFIYTGSYRVPIVTITGDVMKDFLVVDKVVGVGEIAISDHRSSQPTPEQFAQLASDARVGGMLSGKAGIVNVHLGDGKRMLELILETVNKTEIPITQFLPTHINRNPYLFEQGIEYAKMGGFVDFTASADPDFWEKDGEVRTSKGIKRMLDEGVSSDNFGISSDAQGSLPIFNEKMECIGVGVGKSDTLLTEVRDCVFKRGIPLEIAIKAITSNPAKFLKMKAKGHVKEGFDADLCILNEKDLALDTVVINGRIMVQDGKPIAFGTFEPKE